MEERIYLRALEPEDLDRIHKWHNNRDMYRIMGGHFRYVSKAATKQWLEKKMGYLTDEVSLAICIKETSQHIGNIYLRNIDWIDRHAEMQIWIGEAEMRAKGYGTEAHALLQNHAVQDLGLRRLYAYIQEGNPSQFLAKKLGLTIEGTLRNHALINGEWKNFIIMSVCFDESGNIIE
jgi:RimJ/RimL family protein N-acetyltransferase